MAAGVTEIYVIELDEILKSVAPEAKATQAQTENALKEAKEILGQLKLAVSSITDKKRKDALDAKIRSYDNEMSKIKRNILLEPDKQRPSQTKAEAASESLIILERSRQQLIETEDVGANILVNLDKQKETIKRSHNNLKETHAQLRTGDKLMNKMSKWWRG